MGTNPLDMIESILGGGLRSKRLDAYLAMRKLVAQKLGDNAAPIFTLQQVRESILLQMKREITAQYKHNEVLRKVASMFYRSEITESTPMTDLAKMVTSHVGGDFGLTDLDVLAELVVAVTGRDIVFNGNMLRYSTERKFDSFDEVKAFITKHGGRV